MEKKQKRMGVIKNKALTLHSQFRNHFSIEDDSSARRDGRVVDYSGLENRRDERHRGFEALSLRNIT